MKCPVCEHNCGSDCICSVCKFQLQEYDFINIIDAENWKKTVLNPYKIQFLNKEVSQGNPAAMNNLGLMYALGNGVEKDFKKAVLLFQNAINQGLSAAAYSLAWIYDYDENLTNYHLAFEYYRKAYDMGYNDPMLFYHLGKYYRDGIDGEVNYQEAIFFLKSLRVWFR